MIIKRYSELITLPTFEERYEYLKLNGQVGKATFGFERYLNQRFYTNPEWLSIRNEVIVRDNGCDLAIDNREIYGRIIIHHMNPITKDDIINRTKFLLDPEYLITVMDSTHNAIHYGDGNLERDLTPTVRTKHDTCPWR